MPRKPLLSFLLPRSPLQNNDSPSSPASPLPPTPNSERQRLQLRTLVSLKSPAFPPLFTATIPKTPYPWIWKCHLCGSVYRLGVTRRCLEDGHFFCSNPTPLPSPVHNSDESKSQEPRKTKKRKPTGCRAEFDYTGWEAYNEWRREIRGIKYQCASSSPPSSSSSSSDRRSLTTGLEEEEVGNEKKDCYRDCDFPSECLNERIRAREFARLRERERERMRMLEEEWAREREASLSSSSPFFLLAASASAPVQDPIIDPVIDIDDDIKMTEFFATDLSKDTQQNDTEAREVMGEENLGPLGTDSDGLGEESKEVAYSACRRKSLDAGTETPRSPLKECFGVEGGGCGVGIEMHEIVL